MIWRDTSHRGRKIPSRFDSQEREPQVNGADAALNLSLRAGAVQLPSASHDRTSLQPVREADLSSLCGPDAGWFAMS